jgi:NAD(P)-dependent dehydrogenase (short-subunit alcohol dehydrogenase family)
VLTDQADDRVRRAIRDAMDRLIAGKTLHSDGKLTVKSLAEEARVKRWLLTHRHTDLQDEFRARIASTNAEPPIQVALRQEKADAQDRIKALTADVTALTATVHQLERIISRSWRWRTGSSDQAVWTCAASYRCEPAIAHDAMSTGVRGACGPTCPEMVSMLTDLSGKGGYASEPARQESWDKERTRWR